MPETSLPSSFVGHESADVAGERFFGGSRTHDMSGDFIALDSQYGRFIVNRHCQYQASSLLETGRPHIQAEINLLLELIPALPDEAVVVDAGANAGFISVPLAHALRAIDGTLHAFEPQRMLYYALCGTIALNDLDNVHVHNLALGAELSRVTCRTLDYSAKQDHGLFSLLAPFCIDEDAEQPQTVIDIDEQLVALPKLVFTQDRAIAKQDVEIVTIDSLNLPRLDLLKIDVEGMEISVLQGARQMLVTYQPWCWLEYWKHDINEIKRQFAGLSYRFFKIDAMTLLCVPNERTKHAAFSTTAIEIF